MLDRDSLKQHYRGDEHQVDLKAIPSIDFVLIQPDGRTLSVAEAAGPGAPFDWIVASHVIEHVPDLIGWLDGLAEVTLDNGALGLIIPDMRFTFDVHRPLTTVGQMIQAAEDQDVRPSVRAVYDHFSAATSYDPVAIWHGDAPDFTKPSHEVGRVDQELARCLDGVYVDCHVWLFTPESFLQQMREAGAMVGRRGTSSN